MHLLTDVEDGRWYLTHHGEENRVIDVVTAENQPMAALEVAHLVPGAGEWEWAGDRQYRYRPAGVA